MEDKIRCQSCGMPLMKEHPDFLGTNSDGSHTLDYCLFCYKNGAFTKPEQTMEEMIQSSVGFMSQKLKFSREKAEKMSRDIIPKLKRWAK